MKWVKDLEAQGLISKTASESIQAEVAMLTKSAANPLGQKEKEMLKDSLKGFGKALGGLGALGALSKLWGSFEDHMKVNSDVNAVLDVRKRLEMDPFLAENKELALQRHKEIARHAPVVAANFDMSQNLIKKTLRSGIADSDIEKLKMLQMTASVPQGSYGSQDALSNRLMPKMASISPEAVGVIAYDIHTVFDTFEKTSSVSEKTASFYEQMKRVMSGRMGNLLALSALGAAASGAVAATAGAVAHVRDRMHQAETNKKLEESFNMAIKESPTGDILKEKPIQARKAFETLVHFSPAVASEPRAARSFMQKMLAYEDQAIQPSDIKDLVEIERNFRSSASQSSPFFSAFSQTGKMVGMDSMASKVIPGAIEPYHGILARGAKLSDLD